MKAVWDRVVSRYPSLRQFAQFCLVGGSGLVVDTIVYVALTELRGTDPRLATIPAFLVAVTWNFMLNRLWTFRQKSTGHLLPAYLRFVGVCGGGWLVRFLIISMLLQIPLMARGRMHYLANFAGILVATLFNFLGSKYFAFAPGKQVK